MKHLVTINTDAGLLVEHQLASYAYWIKGDNLHLHGSGLIRVPVPRSQDAETMAIAKALSILKCSGHRVLAKIIINRDCIDARHERSDFMGADHCLRLLTELHKWVIDPTIKFGSFVEYRHVKGHSRVQDKRSYVNGWLDRQCRKELNAWRKQQQIGNP